MTKKQAGAVTFLAIVVTASLLAGLVAAQVRVEEEHEHLQIIGTSIAASLLPALLSFRQFGHPGALGYLRSLIAALLAAGVTGAIVGAVFVPFAGALVGLLSPIYLLQIPSVAIMAILGLVVTHQIGKLQHRGDRPNPSDAVQEVRPEV
ncbi:MAG: hypothetical protein RIC87_24605 [Kiloniellales bacterium]